MTTFGDRLFQNGGTPVGGDLLSLMGKGKVLYVDPVFGSDGNNGLTPKLAKATMQNALDNGSSYSLTDGTSDGKGDVIIRMPGFETVTAKIDADSRPNVTIVAATAGQQLFGDRLAAFTQADSGYTSGPVLDISYRSVSLYGLGFSSRATAGENDKEGSIVRYIADSNVSGGQASGGGQFFTVRNCLFRDGAAGNPFGIYLEGAGPCQIMNNQFGYATAGIGPGGIALHGSLSNNTTDVNIQDNLFFACPVGVRFDNGTHQWVMLRKNVFFACTDGLHFGANATITLGLISNNEFDTATGADSWLNDGGSGQSVANIRSDFANVRFHNNIYGLTT